jgi:hypothetical protein
VFLTAVNLSSGMNFILHEIQRVMINNGNDSTAILAAIRKHVPTTLT